MSPQRISRRVAFGLAIAAFTVPPPAAAQDLRSPDARDDAPVSRAAHDLRSPDARSIDSPAVVGTGGDLRSPDSRDAGEGRGSFSAPDVMVVRMSEPAASPVTDDRAGLGRRRHRCRSPLRPRAAGRRRRSRRRASPPHRNARLTSLPITGAHGRKLRAPASLLTA